MDLSEFLAQWGKQLVVMCLPLLCLTGCVTPAPPLPTRAVLAPFPATFTPPPTHLPATATTIPPKTTATPTDEPQTTPVATLPVAPPLPTVTSSVTATPVPPYFVNGLPVTDFILLPPPVLQHMQNVFALGQTMGRDKQAFSKMGDSLTLTSSFLGVFELAQYDLGAYEHLQGVIDYFAGSYQRYGVAVKVSLRAQSVFDPLWADDRWCFAAETMIDCEFRYNNPSILIIQLGTNDTTGSFADSLHQLVSYTIENGVIPILITKADRFEGEDDRNNVAIRAIATELRVPLVDFDKLSNTLPDKGRGADGVHLTTVYPMDYTMTAAFERGYPMHNLAVLFMLDALWQGVIEENGR
jgi:hypothetical protein